MKALPAALLLAVGIVLAGAQGAHAQMASAMMPTCPSTDPVVGVNTTTKMYMTQAQMKAKSAGMTPAQKKAMMEKNHVKLMCKSAAVKMGAKPAPSM
ncbi:MAG TPA: hypothetical protein VJP76_05865 [Candidatus Tumulicola sp.]|nr:hypothetical protein [Candidatus Tumulicola sp.]